MKNYEIHTTESDFINGNHLVEVSFQMPYREWCKFEKSIQWQNVAKLLSELERVEGGEEI